MIIGFFGKGGSGKSSLATQMALHLHAIGKEVLAIDADHNIDLAYNLTNGSLTPDMPSLGDALAPIRSFVGLEDGGTSADVFSEKCAMRFSLNPLDAYTDKYTHKVTDRLRVMMAGAQTDTVLYGKACSHILTTPLKIYLPLLKMEENDVVVMDEKAGADGVTTGIVTGVDVGVIVCEASSHSIKTAKQIAELMDFFETPYVFVGNKITGTEDRDYITQHLEVEPIAFLPDDVSVKRNPSRSVSMWSSVLEKIRTKLANLNQHNRMERTVRKFKRNRSLGV